MYCNLFLKLPNIYSIKAFTYSRMLIYIYSRMPSQEVIGICKVDIFIYISRNKNMTTKGAQTLVEVQFSNGNDSESGIVIL